jgi:hypothetical protein
LTFTTQFSVINPSPLYITSFGFINATTCFGNTSHTPTETGSATLVTGSTDQVTGTLNFTVTSITPAGNTLALTGNLTGTSNGTTGTTGTLSNGLVSVM